MRLALRLCTVALACCLVPSLAFAQTNFMATMTGLAVVPPTASAGWGMATCIYVEDAQMMSYSVLPLLTSTVTGITINGPAAIGQNAGVQFTLNVGMPSSGVVGPLSAQQVADLRAGLWYVVVKSTSYPNGEIRGQLLDVTAVQPSSWSEIKTLYAH